MLPSDNFSTVRPPAQEKPSLVPMSRWRALLVIVAALLVLGVWTFSTPQGVLGKANAIGYAICHRIAARSFLINAQPMPLCARCTGIYLGVMVSFVATMASGRGKASRMPPLALFIAFGLFVVLIAIDGINSYFHLFPGYHGLYEPHNILRLVTGTYAGLVLFHVIYPMFNSLAWQPTSPSRTLNSIAELVGLGVLAAIVILLVLTERTALLWIFGIASALGVVLMLLLINTAMFLNFSRLYQRARSLRDLVLPLIAGFAMAFVELGGIALVRYALTGTWAGFSLGG